METRSEGKVLVGTLDLSRQINSLQSSPDPERNYTLCKLQPAKYSFLELIAAQDHNAYERNEQGTTL